eukprot:SAG22_NODE_10_length_35702_cov_72.266992_12_plen_93_part_00
MKTLLRRVEEMHATDTTDTTNTTDTTDTTDDGPLLCRTSSVFEPLVRRARIDSVSIRAPPLRADPFTLVAMGAAPLPQSTQLTPSTPTNSPR